MGITPAVLRLLARECRRSSLEGGVLTFGTQDVWGDHSDVERILSTEGLMVKPHSVRTTSSAFLRSLPASRLFIHPSTLFEMLGFTDYVDVDNSTRDGSAFMHDLNEPPPVELAGRFDLVLDLGTTEHIFDVPNVLNTVRRALKVGGVVVHSLPLPTLHWSQHGYYCFNPELLRDYYRLNGFDEIDCKIIYYNPPLGRPADEQIYFRRAWIFDYTDGVNLPSMVPAGAVATIWFVARKNADTTSVRLPNQRELQLRAVTGTQARRGLRAIARKMFHLARPILGATGARLYAAAQGVVVQQIQP